VCKALVVSAGQLLMASKIKVCVYIMYVCVLCIIILHIYIHVYI